MANRDISFWEDDAGCLDCGTPINRSSRTPGLCASCENASYGGAWEQLEPTESPWDYGEHF
jgi:hypothetical protein